MIEFEWDDGNLEHIALHNVDREEAEYVVLHDPLDLDLQVRNGEERFVQVGATWNERVLRIVTIDRGNLIRIVTAYDAPRSDRIAYLIWRGERDGTEA